MSLTISKNEFSPSILSKGIFLGQIFFLKVLLDKKTYILIFVSILPLLPCTVITTTTVNDYVNMMAILISSAFNFKWEDHRLAVFFLSLLSLVCFAMYAGHEAQLKPQNEYISLKICLLLLKNYHECPFFLEISAHITKCNSCLFGVNFLYDQ